MEKTYHVNLADRIEVALLTALVRAGLKMGTTSLLTVRGRKSGQPHTVIVVLVEQDGKRFLVAPYGVVQWVRNIRAAGTATLTRGRRSEEISVTELEAKEAAPVLKQYLSRVSGGVRSYFDVRRDSPLEAFEREAPRHPVLQITVVEKSSQQEGIPMPVVLGLVPFVLVIVIIWPIVALARQRKEPADYPLTASVAAWYAQIMAMVGIVVFTAGIGYLFKGLIGYLNLSFSYGPASFPMLGAQGPVNAASLEPQRLVDLAVRTPVLLVSGPVIYFVHASLSRAVSPQRVRAPSWVRRGSQLVQTMFLGVTSTLCSLLALNLLLGYLVTSPLPNQANEPFGEMLGFALAFTGAFVAHVLIWRSYPGGTWWSPPENWPPQRKTPSPDRAHGPAAS